MTDDHTDPIDLSPLDPTDDRERFDRIVAAIHARVADQLATRRASANLIAELARWRRPMLAAAAVAAIIAVGVLTRSPRSDSPFEIEEIAQAIGVPGQLAPWVLEDQMPTTADLFSSFEVAR